MNKKEIIIVGKNSFIGHKLLSKFKKKKKYSCYKRKSKLLFKT